MADWLAYGLEDAYTERPDIGVIRKAKNTSGLIKYQPKGDPSDWAAATKAILTAEKPDIIVVMLGINDRVSLREPVTEKSDKLTDKKNDKDTHAKGDAKSDGKGGAKPDVAQKPEVDTELPQDDADIAKAPPAKSSRSPNGLYEFGEDRWGELYSKKIEEMIAVVKSKGVPVIWVGLPAIRGPKGTSDMLFLDLLIVKPPARPASPMSTSGMALSMKAASSCRRGLTSKARSASCVLTTASSSPKPARASSHTMSSARSRACSRRGQVRSRCRPSPRRLTSTPCPASPRRVRWRGQSCR